MRQLTFANKKEDSLTAMKKAIGMVNPPPLVNKPGMKIHNSGNLKCWHEFKEMPWDDKHGEETELVGFNNYLAVYRSLWGCQCGAVMQINIGGSI